MNPNEFIQSGILEAYALGHCSPGEMAEVEGMASKFPEVKAELQAIESALENYATANAVQPPDWMKGRILEQIENLKTSPTENNLQELTKDKYLIPKTLVLIFGFLAALWFLRNWQLNFENDDLKKQVSGLETQIKECQNRENERLKLEQQIAFLKSQETKRVEMQAEDGRSAMVFQNPETKQAFLSITNLPQLPDNQDYQLWVIAEGNPAPQPLDVFQSGENALDLLPVQFREKAQAFAVSIEPKGGSPNGLPTTVVMLGKV